MIRWTVLIPDVLPPPADIEQSILGSDVELILLRTNDAATIPESTWRRVDALIAWHEIQVTSSVIALLDQCKVIVRCGVGFDNVDLGAAGQRAIPVCNIPDYGTADVADHTLALLLTLARGICRFNERVRESDEHWHWWSGGTLYRLAGMTLGIIGLGRIGTAVALRAKAFGMRVLAYDPYMPDGREKSLGIERVEDLSALLGASDVVSFHAPLTDETNRMAGVSFFERMKRGAIVINTARGKIIDLDALEWALRTGVVRAAGLDVLESEPPDPRHPLIQAWRAREDWLDGRLVITPHAAFLCEEAYAEMRRKAASTVRRALEGLPLRNVVNAAFFGH